MYLIESMTWMTPPGALTVDHLDIFQRETLTIANPPLIKTGSLFQSILVLLSLCVFMGFRGRLHVKNAYNNIYFLSQI